MPLNLQKPITYLITSGAATTSTSSSTEDFSRILKLVAAAVAARVDLVQIREKKISASVLFELTQEAVHLTRGTATRVLVNDRADIAAAAGAAGVHLTVQSLEPAIIRLICGNDFLIGASTHSLAEARLARAGGADFVVFGPVFETDSKRAYGLPVGVEKLREAARDLEPFPILALGGVTAANAADCFEAGASGIAVIRLFGDHHRLVATVRELHQLVDT